MSLFLVASYIAIALISISTLLTLIRFFKGPSLPDRVIALDVFSANLLAGLAIFSVLSEEKAYLNVALIMSLIAFVGTMTFAYYLVQKRHKHKENDERYN